MTNAVEHLRCLVLVAVRGRQCPICSERHHNLEAHHYVDHASGI